MKYRDAKRLHTGDEVTITETGETGRVVEIEFFPSSRRGSQPDRRPDLSPAYIMLGVVTASDDYARVCHTEVS
jgi:hypothetical protein